MSRKEVKLDFANIERKYADQTKTLSQFVDHQVANIWDAALMTDAELLILKERISKKSSPALIILELK